MSETITVHPQCARGASRSLMAVIPPNGGALDRRPQARWLYQYTTDLRRLDRPGEGRVGVSLQPVKSNTYG